MEGHCKRNQLFLKRKHKVRMNQRPDPGMSASAWVINNIGWRLLDDESESTSAETNRQEAELQPICSGEKIFAAQKSIRNQMEAIRNLNLGTSTTNVHI